MQTVFLLHSLPDGSSHVDWLIEVDGHSSDRVPTFRLETRPDVDGLMTFRAERLADHRRFYLSYEGAVSGGRGVVRRLARGVVMQVAGLPNALDLSVEIAGGRWRWVGEPVSGPFWEFLRADPMDLSEYAPLRR